MREKFKKPYKQEMSDTSNPEIDNATSTLSDEFLTSAQAAKRLGLSMATIQKLVDNKVLQAWKTFGGHRRIALASVLHYQSLSNFPDAPRQGYAQRAKVMLVIESPELTARLKEEIHQWHLPVQIVFQESLTEALLELLNDKHDLLVIQMSGLRKQQEKVLEILQKFMSSRHSVAHSLILTQEDDLLPIAKPGAPVSIQVFKQDLSPWWLSAYLSGFIAQRRE